MAKTPKPEGPVYPLSYSGYFIPEFIYRMRRHRDCVEKPSPRQSIVIYKLLMLAFMKHGSLDFQDLVNAAVISSRVDNQGIAEKIAVDILLDLNEERILSDSGERSPISILTPKTEEVVRLVEEGRSAPKDYEAMWDASVQLFKEYVNAPDLGVGPGEDELIQSLARSMRKSADEESRRILAELLREMLLRLAREFERRSESIHNPVLRPFEYGEDPELIDEEGSLENLFDQGKRVEEIRYDDFLMRKKQRKRKTIVYVQDISNTMFYDLEGLTSISYSLLALIPLLWALRRERYGLVVYESNGHVLKDLSEQRDEEELLNILLALVTSSTTEAERIFGKTRSSQFWGGTVPTTSLEWAQQKLEETRDKSDKICFFFSDFVLEEPGTDLPEKLKNYDIIEEMIKKGIKVLACVSPLAYSDLFRPYTREVLSKVEKTGCQIIETKKPSTFLEYVQTALEGK